MFIVLFRLVGPKRRLGIQLADMILYFRVNGTGTLAIRSTSIGCNRFQSGIKSKRRGLRQQRRMDKYVEEPKTSRQKITP
jgi:hypothetical protein